jgi:hypothetical protein
MAEAVNNNDRNQQRHEEIEIAFQDARALRCHTFPIAAGLDDIL